MKLTYTNNDNFIEDAATLLIEKFLNLSNSTEGNPSDCSVRGEVFDAVIRVKYTTEEWNELDKPYQRFEELNVDAMANHAARIADEKWEAVKTLLGL